MINKWNDVSFSLTEDLTEQVSLQDLPILLGRSGSLDKKIAIIFRQTEKFTSGWLVEDDLLVLPETREGTSFIEIEMHGKSSGYYDSGSYAGHPDNWYPPEGDDERELTHAIIYFYDEENCCIDSFKTKDGNFLCDLERIFEDRINEVELNQAAGHRIQSGSRRGSASSP